MDAEATIAIVERCTACMETWCNARSSSPGRSKVLVQVVILAEVDHEDFILWIAARIKFELLVTLLACLAWNRSCRSRFPCLPGHLPSK